MKIEWTAEMLDILKHEYPSKSNLALAKELRICPTALVSKANKLGLKKDCPRKKIDWTLEMMDILISKYPVCSNEDVANVLGISVISVTRKAKELSLKKFGKLMDGRYEAIKIVKAYYGKLPINEIARKADVSRSTVSRIAKQLGLKLTKEQFSALTSKSLKASFRYNNFLQNSGMPWKMNRVLGFCKRRHNMKYRLQMDGYVIDELTHVAYYTENMTRHYLREQHAEAMGMVFIEYPLPYVFDDSNEGAYAQNNNSKFKSMKITGKVIEVLPYSSGTSKKGKPWQSQKYVLETSEKNPKRLLFEVFGDEDIHKFNIQKDEVITVDYDPEAKEYNGNWFGSNRAKDVTRDV